MLDGIRANAQSLGVKLAFGIIIVVFVFWGVGSYTGPKGLVASVNGKNITEVEFQRAYAMMEDNLRRSIPNMTQEMLESFQLEQRVLQSLIQEKLIEDEAERAGLTISAYELRALLEQLPYFQKDGKFDPEVYKEVLSKNHITPRQFETDQAKSMLPAKLQRLVTAGAYVSPVAVKAIFDYAAERRRVDYILFPASAHKDKAAPSEEDIVKTYEAQSASFTVPPSVNVEFVKVLDDHTLKMRVWERGSGETFACGTGACASAVAACLNGYCKKGSDITVRLLGGDLVVNYTDDAVYMTGDAVKVFEGSVEI